MRTVWKFQIPFLSEVVGSFDVPAGAQLVHVAPEDSPEPAVSLWFEVESTNDTVLREFQLFGTGHPIPLSVLAGVHVGTAVVAAGLVLHVYERSEAPNLENRSQA